MLNSFYRASLLIAIIPDMCYRESILVCFRRDPRYQPSGTNEKIFHPQHFYTGICLGVFQIDACQRPAGMTEGDAATLTTGGDERKMLSCPI